MERCAGTRAARAVGCLNTAGDKSDLQLAIPSEIRIKSLLKWATSSLLGHMVLLGAAFGVAESLAFLYSDYLESTLTVTRVLYVVSISFLLGTVVALLCWYTVTLPLIK